MKTTKLTESPEVINARQRVKDLSSQIEFAREELDRLRDAHCQAQKELSDALLKADEHLPQATLWKGGRFETDKKIGKVVILRRTPKGHLVCRLAGSSLLNEIMRFTPPKHEWDNKFHSAEKRDYLKRYKYLLDVPEEYIKAARKQNT
jgi:hypothetical protein